jgi:hypothetical protein
MAAIDTASSNVSPIEAATRVHNLVYLAYVAVLVLAAFFTWLAWKTGNKVQDAIRADANARIAEADSKAEIAKLGAATANEGAAKANERTTALELELASQKTELAKYRERAAIAERTLLELQEWKADRRLTSEQKAELTAKLLPFSGQTLNIMVVHEYEPINLENDIGRCLTDAGWVFGTFVGTEGSRSVRGVAVELNPHVDGAHASYPAAQALADGLREASLATWGAQYRVGPTGALSGEDKRLPGAPMTLVIGRK